MRHNNSRTVIHKVQELLASIALSFYFSKEQILDFYINSVPMGHGIIGFGAASEYYFDKKIEDLNENEIKLLLRTIKNPRLYNPLAQNLIKKGKEKGLFSHELRPTFNSEITPYCEKIKICRTSIDRKLTDSIRKKMLAITERLWDSRARNAAVVIYDVKHKNVLALIGSPDPSLVTNGYQLDMTRAYRAVGSTFKPFFYALAFARGLGPESYVNDGEIKLPLNSGFSLYPKNFDGLYRGEITLKESLAQSLNIPAVKVLDYVGLVSFYEWLEHAAGAKLLQKGIDYGSSTALGALELTPLYLGYLFTALSNKGILENYTLASGEKFIPFGLNPSFDKKKTLPSDILDKKAVLEINAILKDRFLGVDQFGVNSNLQLSIDNYALKTGTSKDYHDSWVVGYTPEIVVVVWMGNVVQFPLHVHRENNG